jgi:hypothetical protein
MGFPAPTEEEAAASTARIMAQLDLMAQRNPPDHVPPTATQVEDARRGLAAVVERIRAERQAVRDCTARVEAERAAGAT